MGLIDSIKKNAENNGTKIQSSVEHDLEKIFNKMFYCDKVPDEEVKFINQMMTRGADTQERIGLHASALIQPPSKYCLRQQVLSLIYKMDQGEQVPIGLKRIFEEGNAIHEKWQRLFIRAGYAKAEDCDFTRFDERFEVSFTPDVIVDIPGFGKMVVEIKSVNTFQFKKMHSHPSGKKQLMFYMYLTGIHQGIVLCDDKNTQDFKVFYYQYDEEQAELPIGRAKEIRKWKKKLLKDKKICKRVEGCNKSTCKRASECPMRDACYNVGKGKVLNRNYDHLRRK